MNFSIVFPTRERLILLKKCLDAIKNMTDDLANTEVLLAIDVDDKTDYTFLNEYSFVKHFRVKRSLNFSKDYYNFLAKQSSGRWIIAGNDDACWETLHWDTIAYNILKDKPNVIYAFCEDGLGGARARGQGMYACFPLIGREGYEALGFYFPEYILTWGADIYLRKLYDAINSVIDIPIVFRHYCHHNRTREQDHISRRIAQHQTPYRTNPLREELEKMHAALGKYSNSEKRLLTVSV